MNRQRQRMLWFIQMTSYPRLNPAATSTGRSDNLRMSGDAASTCRCYIVTVGTPSLASECGIVRVGHGTVSSGSGGFRGTHLQRDAHRAYKNTTRLVNF